MINYIVTIWIALLEPPKTRGVKIDANEWMNPTVLCLIYDLDGNKIELWQAAARKPIRAFHCTYSIGFCGYGPVVVE